jgi:hypothetical protein
MGMKGDDSGGVASSQGLLRLRRPDSRAIKATPQ